MKSKPLPSLEEVQSLLDYNPESGEMTWKQTRRGAKAGGKAGTVTKHGYIEITVKGKRYCVHRLAWLLMTGEDPGEHEIDHENRVRNDNRFSNLRLATRKENMRNMDAKGVCFDKSMNKWRAQLRFEGKNVLDKRFDCPLMARIAYLDARTHYFGEFA